MVMAWETILKTIDNPFCSMDLRIEALETILSKNILFPNLNNLRSDHTIDLHIHTNYSDGFWTPTGMFLEAYKKGMNLISLTDHDCFNGIEEAFLARDLIYKVTGKIISFIPGVEFSTNYKTKDGKVKEIHILGYFPSKDFKEFRSYLERFDIYDQAYLDAFQKCRILRIYEMVKKFNKEMPSKIGGDLLKLAEIQEPISYKTAKRGMRGSVSPGRLLTCTGIYEIYSLYKAGRIDEITDEHFSKAYLDKLVDFIKPYDSPLILMYKFFGNHKPTAKVGYIGKTEDPKWAVNLIKKMGGIPILAHPLLYFDLFKELVEQLYSVGLSGVELIWSDSTHNDINQIKDMENFIKKNFSDLLITAGSDCHGHSIDGHINYTPDNIMGLSSKLNGLLTQYHKQIMDFFRQ